MAGSPPNRTPVPAYTCSRATPSWRARVIGAARRFGPRASALAFVAGVGLAFASGSACSSSGGKPALSANCALNSDCDSPLVCVFSRCHTPCENSRDCPAGERCVPSSEDGGASPVCQLPDEATCSSVRTCTDDQVCGGDDQCRAPCQPSASSCLPGQSCLPNGGGETACFDPNNATDLTAIQTEGDAATTPADGAGGTDGSSDATTSGDASATSDAPSDAPFVPNPDAGSPLGFALSNVNLGAVDGGVSAGDGGAGSSPPDAGVFAGAPGVSVSQSCNDVSCLPPPMTVTLSNGNSAALYLFESLTVVQTAALRFTGTLPIVVVARSSVNVQGQILVNGVGMSSAAGPGGFYGANPGPGAGASAESAGYPSSASGGGSYCGEGGSAGASPLPAAPGGATYGSADLIPLVGGSAGGSFVSSGGNTGGPGGGAIEIVAGQEITIGQFGAIHAGGGGGGGYAFTGGGGSGGAILLEAPVVAVSGALAANGGGAGEEEGPGGGSGFGADSTASAQAAPGYSGIGGSGSAGTSINGASGIVPDGSGAFGSGGGGAGRIRINTAGGAATIAPTAVISPALSTPCATQGTID